MHTPHVQLIVDQNNVPRPLQTALNRVKARVSLRSLDKALASGVSPSADVCVILPRHRATPDVLGRILADASERACATMVIPPGPDWPTATTPQQVTLRRLSAPESDESLGMSADELTGRIKALCEIRHPLRQMREELTRLREREAQRTSEVRHIDQQLRLAGQIQRDLLPPALPDTGPLSVSTLYLPADFVSGDLYDLTRLDEDRFGLSLADATGHGLPAALLTILIKNSLRGKEIAGESYRIIEPDELLTRLNMDLLSTPLSECQFITALHAVFDRSTQRIRWARGGSPYPILLRPGQSPRQIASEGALIGAFENQTFETVEHTFESGDVLVFFTDGLEALLLKRDGSFREEGILQCDWLELLAVEGPAIALEEIRRLAADAPEDSWSKDDITVMALKMN
ncbi:MAG: hypothetical protein AMXMBFR13_46650 [Phycisphaerae bacterium]